MINKKNVLGKQPLDLGTKDAIHVAIVAVRAGAAINPGERCGLNGYNEAVPDANGPGVADPFLKRTVTTGQAFWLLLDQDEVPNVRHEWDHPTVKFAPPTREVQLNRVIKYTADALGVTYQQVMDAAAHAVTNGKPTAYPGTKTRDEYDEAMDQVEIYDFWSEWAEESGHVFENHGTSCCPEYAYPECALFKF